MTHRGGQILLAKNGFTDQEGVKSGPLETLNLAMRPNPTLGDAKDCGRHQRGEALGSAKVDGEVAKVAIVHSDDRCAGFETTVSSRSSWTSTTASILTSSAARMSSLSS